METTRLELKVELPPLLREIARVRMAGGGRAQVLAAAERSAHGVIVIAGGRLVAANRAAERIWSGRQRAESSAESKGFELVGEDGRPWDLPTWASARRGVEDAGSDEPVIEEVLIHRRDGSHALVLGGCGVVRDGADELFVCVFGEPPPSSKQAVENAHLAHHRVSLLAQATAELLSTSLDPDQTLQHLARLLVPGLADGCSIHLIDDTTGIGRRVVDLWTSPEMGERFEQLMNGSSNGGQPRWLRRLVRTGVAELYPSLSQVALRAVVSDPERLEAVHRGGAHSVMFAPLRSRRRVIGGIAVVSTDPERAYEPADIDMLEQLASSAGFAVENARLYRYEQYVREGVEAAAKRLGRLQELMRKLGHALTPDDVARVLVEHPIAADATMGGIWRVDDGMMELVYTNRRGAASALQRFPVEEQSVVHTALSTKRPVFASSPQEIADRYPVSARRFEAQAIACCPLLEDDSAMGVLLFTFDRPHTFDPDEQAFFMVMAEHGAEAMRRARAYEAEQRARSEMSMLYGLLETVNRATTLDEVCEPALDVIERAMGVNRASVLLIDEKGAMRFGASRGISEEYRKAVEGPSPWPREIREPAPIVVSDVATNPKVAQYRDALLREKIHALAFFPLAYRGKLLGRISVYSSVPRQFSAREVQLAETIAAQVAQAVARKRQEAEVQAARAAAEHANRMKDEFLAVVSHELRTPLSAILGWSALLQTERRNDPATLEKGLRVIERNAKAQATIIDDILDMSRVIRGKLVLDAHPVALAPIVAETIESLKTSAAAKQINLELVLGSDDCVLVGDAERLRQITWNLLSNAVKFTPRGGSVQVRLRREATSIVLEVEDTGSGIEPDVLPFVFDRFRQADSSPTRRTGGLGLGLAIVRQLVELHGGQVTARSGGPGKGSTFTVTFPIRALASAPPPAEQARAGERRKQKQARAGKRPDLEGARVLVVDDEADAREVVREALASYGAVVDVAGSASEALGALRRFRPSVLVLDIGMPDEDGYALLRRIRALPGPLGCVPAVAMTAYARAEDVAEARAAGFQEHVAKPAHPDELARAVARALRSRGDGKSSGRAPVSGPERSSGRSSRMP